MKLFNKREKIDANKSKTTNLNKKPKKENEENESIFIKNVKTIKDLIANEYIDFSESYKYALIGEKYMKNMYLGIMPATVDFAASFHSLYNYQDIDTSIFIEPIPSEQAKADLSRTRTNLETEYLTAGGSNNRRDDMAAKINEAARLRDEIRDGKNKAYQVSIQSTLYSNNLRELDNSTSQIKSLLGTRDIGLKSATYIQEDCYKSNKPFLNNLIGEWHTFDKRSLACIFPFTSNNINHENGVLIGFNKDNGLPIIYDTFHDKLDNYNMCIFAKSGGGKSSFIKLLSARSSTLDNIITVALDIEPEYRDIALTLGGINVTISAKAEDKTIINPFDVTVERKKSKITGRMKDEINLQDKVNSVTSIILTMAKGFTNGNLEYYNDITRTIIKECINACYAELEITDEINSIYEFKTDPNNLMKVKCKKDMPTLSMWYTKLQIEADKNKKDTYKKYYDYLLKVMTEFCTITNGGFTCFDGQSTVNLTYDTSFINFDLSQLNENTELPLAQHIVCDYIWENLVKTNNKGYKIRCLIDEAWRMAQVVNGEPKFPEALEFLDKMFRRARKKNTSAVIISQQFNEFYNDLTQSIIRNADTKVFLPPDETSIDSIKEVFHLTDGEAYYLKRIRRGEALFKCNTVSAKLDIEIPPFEMAFIETNQNAKKN
ncbi:DUF87 domain-containing protein [Clostridium botulinum]|uniref:Conjugal transfer protein TraC n=1 Tax=Clostridium botulinum TaxID=1491 RepID=A0A140C2X6_CLOBO|nr:DUF87 domain-containing protein [Clostridium botulinum]ALT05412.1 conjugal transfer protein TraC [Clostridium botulinum]ALT05510.1 conjugal transfer protein TraC [Clostridium botulinum]ALT05608.1 conjugal transfer protein TraC/VirB4 [Clostridium botulinum]ALT05708.1 conjugal transfer protein TraC/VirB4 [Clostridium botulinum]ALT05810.1 conjugal transfer protein TraC/VirB4 [Clostridium botulinum]